jgi:hypothetical protein
VYHALVAFAVDPAGGSPRLLLIGPDPAGNLMEVVMVELPEKRFLAIHAMPLRSRYRGLLEGGADA